MARTKKEASPVSKLLDACKFCSSIDGESKTALEFHDGLIMSRGVSGVFLAMPTEQMLPVACNAKHLCDALKAAKETVSFTVWGECLVAASGDLVTKVQTFPAMLSICDSHVLANFHLPLPEKFGADLTRALILSYQFATSPHPTQSAKAEKYAARVFLDNGMVRASNGSAFIEVWVGGVEVAGFEQPQFLNGSLPIEIGKVLSKSKAKIVGISADTWIGFLLDNDGEICATVDHSLSMPSAETLLQKLGVVESFEEVDTVLDAELMSAVKRLKKGQARVSGTTVESGNKALTTESHWKGKPLNYDLTTLGLLDGVASMALHVTEPVQATLFWGDSCRGIITGLSEAVSE